MSRDNLVQQKIKQLSGDAFQKLCDAYLYRKGFTHLTPNGSVPGADKVRTGTPDSFVTLTNGNFVFCEYTTQQTGLFGKLRSDLEKCFSEEKTGIPLRKIECVVLCHTSTLTPAEEQVLREECQGRGVTLHVFGIGPISLDLSQKYHGITRDHLGIAVDTRQILTPNEFVTAYNSGRLSTPLATTFRMRDTEVQDILSRLVTSDVVVISGRPGVGKTRVALEVARRFVEMYPEYESWFVVSRGPDLYEDVRVHFSDAGPSIIVVDDANRTKGLDYIIQTITSDTSVPVKIIATVRDYALESVRDTLRYRVGASEIELKAMTEDEIKILVSEECGIKNSRYLERISEIAYGNPRLAIMAARLATEHQTLDSIRDVSDLYHEYFRSVRNDFREIESHEILKVAGVVAFFRYVYRANQDLMICIQTQFGIPAARFWEHVVALHELEIVDLYENEVAKISDQVLATYLFYLAFFKERVLSIAVLLGPALFPRWSQKLVDALNPLFNTFNFQEIKQSLSPYVEATWTSLVASGDQATFLRFLRLFWFVKETDTLVCLQQLITALVPEPLDTLPNQFKSDSNIDEILGILGQFRYAQQEYRRIALELVLDYLEKRPSALLKVLYVLEDLFGFHYNSRYTIQRDVVQSLVMRVNGGTSSLFATLFLAVAQVYLKTTFRSTELKGERRVVITTFDLQDTPELRQIRATLWNALIQLSNVPAFRRLALKTMHSYSISRFEVNVRDIVAIDAEYVLPFIQERVSPVDYQSCRTVHAYLDLLDCHHMTYDDQLRSKFTTETYRISKLLAHDWDILREVDFDTDQFRIRRADGLRHAFPHYGLTEYLALFSSAIEIKQELEGSEDYQLTKGVSEVLILLGDSNPDLFCIVVRAYLSAGDQLRLQPWGIVDRLIRAVGVDQTIAIVTEINYPTTDRWLLGVLSSLHEYQVTESVLAHLLTLYRRGLSHHLHYPLDYVLKFEAKMPGTIELVISILTERCDSEPGIGQVLAFLFNPFGDLHKHVFDFLAERKDLLQRAYFAVLAVDAHFDSEGTVLFRLIQQDRTFLYHLLDSALGKMDVSPSGLRHRDLSFVWQLEDYPDVVGRILERLFEHRDDWRYSEWLDAAFMIKKKTADVISRRQDDFLMRLVSTRYNDSQFMRFIFGIATRFSFERRRRLLIEFLQHNKDVNDFLRLPMEPYVQSWSGSEVPVLHRRISDLETLLPHLCTSDLLQHRQHIERYINDLRDQMAAAKKSDFIDGEFVTDSAVIQEFEDDWE